MSEAAGKILLLCSAERKQAYLPLLERWQDAIEILHSPDEILARAFRRAPAGVLIDLIDTAYMGRDRLASLLELRVSWPIMRCNTDGQGSGLALWPVRERRCPLYEAIVGMLNPDESWKHPINVRQYIRLEFLARVRIFHKKLGQWRNTNVLNLGIGGMYAVGYDLDWEVGQGVDLELWDLTFDPIKLHGAVAWIRKWEEGNDRLPGIGISIYEDEGLRILADTICQPESIDRLWQHFR